MGKNEGEGGRKGDGVGKRRHKKRRKRTVGIGREERKESRGEKEERG